MNRAAVITAPALRALARELVAELRHAPHCPARYSNVCTCAVADLKLRARELGVAK